MKQNTDVYQLISYLLGYPTQELIDTIPGVKKEIEQVSNTEVKTALSKFVDSIEQTDLENWRERYISYFDFGRSTNLYVTYSKLGEQRQRGIELLKLKDFYRGAGFEPHESELPDYLPLMLEFASQVPLEKSNALLGKYFKEMEAIRNSLHEKDSAYVALFDALFLQMKENNPTLEKSNDRPLSQASV